MSNRSKLPPEVVIAETKTWVERVVVGLNLCPFAKAPYLKGQIRYVSCKAKTNSDLLDALSDQLLFLDATAPIVCETILLIHPFVLNDFFDYNDFLDEADELVDRLGLEGVFQIASFHPQYQFADSGPNDRANFTNRSPYPMLHILREASIDAALGSAPDPQALSDTITRRNLTTLTELPAPAWQVLWP
jgi:hypothetical protein